MSRAQPPAHQMARWVSWLDEQIERSAAAMHHELDGATACRIHKDGRVTGGFKYEEGRMTAFAEARRLARTPPERLDEALTAYERRWLEDLERRTTAESPSMPWVAYVTGGAKAAQRAVAEFHERD